MALSKSLTLILPFIPLSALMVGCGGGGGGSSSPTPTPTPLSPALVGNWAQVAGLGPTGTALDITSTGQVTGTVTPDPTVQAQHIAQISGAVTGTVSANGDTNLSRTESGTQYVLNATLSVNAQGHLVGTFLEAAYPVASPGQSTPAHTTVFPSIQVDMTQTPAAGGGG